MQFEGDFDTDLVMLNRSQMTRMSPQLASPSPIFHTTLSGGRLTHVRLNVYEAYKHGESSVESGYEPGALWLRDLITWLPWPFEGRKAS
ncbi:hypothetical protein AVEN_43493-1 [Araneus ventricosus]|uniref:Uncharacterized protein n=1 Tax=Araneus ventricosus TaxID=182803 RepID=A0A4Y2S6P0_ARAVE|nr:hypothetical protein AVEN_43491-1 [Araneus ventricosus]GBN83643.1 hypothetical protein AVEN_43493-1 [Araneus ventricosus]